MKASASRGALGLLLALLCLFVLAHVSVAVGHAPDDAEYLWDFRLYYFSACADARGLDAYDPVQVSRVADRPVTLPYCYIGPTLVIWRVFTLLPFEQAAWLYLALTLLAAASLMALWQRVFLGDERSWAFLPFCLLAYGATLLTCIATGNAVWIEQVLLWMGLAAYVRGRLAVFTALVVLAGLLKVATLAFLVLLLMGADRRRVACLAGGLAAFGAALAACGWLDPVRWDGWVRNVGIISGERGIVNPSLWPAVQDGLQQIGLPASSPAAYGVYGLAVLAALALSWAAWRRIRRTFEGEAREVRAVFLVALTLAVVSPRFKDYAYVLVLAPTWFVLSRASRDTALTLLVAAAALPLSSALPITRTLSAYLVEYASLWVAMGAWAAFCCDASALQSRYNTDRVPDDPPLH